MITCLKYDPLYEKLWVGTPSSTFHCLDLKASGASEYLSVQGLPWVTDYHVLRNKRFILTNSSDGSNTHNVQLWSTETGKSVKQWQSKTFNQVQTLLNEKFDSPQTIQVPIPSGTPQATKGKDNPATQSVQNPAVPNSWFTCDIRTGSLALHLDEENWHKAIIAKEDYDKVTQNFEPLIGNIQYGTYEDPKINLGQGLLLKILDHVQDAIKDADEWETAQLLKENYQDLLNLKKLNGIATTESTKTKSASKVDPEFRYFVYLEEADFLKPIWTSITGT